MTENRRPQTVTDGMQKALPKAISDELQALCDRMASVPWPFVDIQAEQQIMDTMRAKLPAFLRLARAARRCLDGSEVDGWHTPLREVDVAELREALGELEREQ
jgi:hypothetical protein